MKMHHPSSALLEAVAVTAELCGRTFSEAAARVFVADLAQHPEPAVIKALARCRREVRGALTVADVVSRIDDGRPGAEEAWSMVPTDEAQSVVWTSEIAEAFGIAGPLLADGERIAARLAFKEAYARIVGQARDEGRPVDWQVSLGHDPRGRDAVLRDAVSKGRLSIHRALEISPALDGKSALSVALPMASRDSGWMPLKAI